jgi:hypothetical protein
MKTKRWGWSLVALAIAVTAGGCDTEGGKADDASQQQLKTAGFSDSVSKRLGKLKLTEEEMKQVIASRQSNISETVIADMVASMHEKDLRYEYVSEDIQTLMRQNVGATAVTQLIDMGAVPSWTSDIMALKVDGVSDLAIVEIAKLKFKEKKELLSGGEYGMLKRRGFSDDGLLEFVRKGGTAQQLQRVADEIQHGKPELEAMKAAGL